MTATIVKIGNSNGIIIPSRILKSLALAERDFVEIKECNGGILLTKSGARKAETPFSQLDKWNESHCFSEEFSLDSALEYATSLRSNRNNKILPSKNSL